MKPRSVINLAPQHKFQGLADLPEAQLLMLAPRGIWLRTRTYVPQFEAVHLAGRFGADPGDYEWEPIDQPQGFKWWRRTALGDAAYCAAIIAPAAQSDPIEVFGLIDIASDSPWWLDAVENDGLIQGRSAALVRQRAMPLEEARVLASIEEEYRPRQLLTAEADENGIAWRVGDMAEVTRLKDALIGLFSRARAVVLPEEVDHKP
ncbi:MAG: hypothetical protein HY872_08770 [Chloroflexi bacterium]|nr:hypothetical protein [Chloroflexota bacterium]